MSDSHYEILGADEDASRDEIRAAYRERVGELDPDTWTGDAADRRTRASAVNRAWNVLSDPFQKERYDDQLGAGDVDLTDDDEGDDDDGDGELPARGSRRPARGRGGRDRPTATPTGQPLAAMRARINALSVDVLVILVILVGLSFIIGNVFSESAGEVTIRGDVVRTTELDGRSYRDAKDTEEEIARKEWLDDNSGPLEDKDVEVEKVDVIPRNVGLIGQVVTLILAIGYVTIPSLARGQSPGKRFFKIRSCPPTARRPGRCRLCSTTECQSRSRPRSRYRARPPPSA